MQHFAAPFASEGGTGGGLYAPLQRIDVAATLAEPFTSQRITVLYLTAIAVSDVFLHRDGPLKARRSSRCLALV